MQIQTIKGIAYVGVTPLALIQENYCPVCKKLVTDSSEVWFLHANGMCLGCEHCQADVLDQQKQEVRFSEEFDLCR